LELRGGDRVRWFHDPQTGGTFQRDGHTAPNVELDGDLKGQHRGNGFSVVHRDPYIYTAGDDPQRADSGSQVWKKGSSTWNNAVTVNSDTSMTLRIQVLSNETSTYTKTWTWTVALKDTANKTASKPFTVTYTPSVPQVAGVAPSQPTANPSRQYITILGNNFVRGAQVTLQISSSVYPIPRDRTQFIDSTRIKVRVGLTNSGNWKVWITNPNGQQSNQYSFYVKP